MKKYPIVIIAFLTSSITFAQNPYHPLIDTGKTWNVMDGNGWGSSMTYTYKCEGDTVINDTSYRILYSSDAEFPVSWIKRGFIREDDAHRVYYSRYLVNDTSYFEPLIVYDFNAGLNDTLTINSFVGYGPTEVNIVITAVDSVLIDNEYRKKIHFSCLDYSYEYNFWIEGIGSNNGLLETGFYCYITCPVIELLCVKEQGKIIYQNEYYESCYIVNIEENNQENQAYNIYPNPAGEYLYIVPEFHNNSTTVFTLFNSIGEITCQTKINRNSNTKVLTAGKTAGLYFYTISENGNIRQSAKILIR